MRNARNEAKILQTLNASGSQELSMVDSWKTRVSFKAFKSLVDSLEQAHETGSCGRKTDLQIYNDVTRDR